MEHLITRRAFLAAGAAALASAACAKSTPTHTSTAGTPSTTARSQGAGLDILIATPQPLAGVDQRMTFGLTLNDDLVKDPTGVTVAFGRSFDKVGPAQPVELHSEGIADHPYYKTAYQFAEPGVWVIEVHAKGTVGATQFDVITPQASKVPRVGQQMAPVDTPTTTDPHGVNPICTRSPNCPFHTRTISQALQAGKPTAVLFATPALCQSRVCGPVLDILVGQAPAFADTVQFIHVEVYKSLNTTFSEADLTPGMRAYGLQFEPALFLAGADGIIRERLDGPYDAKECGAALRRLVS